MAQDGCGGRLFLPWLLPAPMFQVTPHPHLRPPGPRSQLLYQLFPLRPAPGCGVSPSTGPAPPVNWEKLAGEMSRGPGPGLLWPGGTSTGPSTQGPWGPASPCLVPPTGQFSPQSSLLRGSGHSEEHPEISLLITKVLRSPQPQLLEKLEGRWASGSASRGFCGECNRSASGLLCGLTHEPLLPNLCVP